MSERQTFNSRHEQRERALQALFALEFTGDPLEQAYFAYTYDKVTDEDETYDVPSFILQLVTGVHHEQAALDEAISAKLKTGWRMDRLSVIDRCLLRLGLYEIAYYEGTPGRVAINEIIELSKAFSEEESSKFINGILTQFVTED